MGSKWKRPDWQSGLTLFVLHNARMAWECANCNLKMNENPFYPRSKADWLLFSIEIITVAIIAIGVALLIGYEIFWVAWPASTTPQYRIEAVLRALNENWKAGLLLLIPLFYRTVRTLLERIRKVPGFEISLPTEAEKEPNPPRKQG